MGAIKIMCFANELNPLVDLICIKCMCLRKFCMNIMARNLKKDLMTLVYTSCWVFVLYEVNFQKQKIKHCVNFDVSLLH